MRNSLRRQRTWARIAALDLEAVSIASVMAAAATLALPIASAPAALVVALATVALPIATVGVARLRFGAAGRGRLA